MARPRLHATNAHRQQAYRLRRGLSTAAPPVVYQELGPCFLLCSRWEE